MLSSPSPFSRRASKADVPKVRSVSYTFRLPRSSAAKLRDSAVADS